ncbi:MAG: biotin--[acetyl-CoA-carboxylase] ligase [Actinomycetota bacterium]|nr:biotin--[acetyl-CoA-carboxylase] ligase [Actinomycetota bacterium]
MDSTNRVASDLVRSGAAEGLVVVAGHQTAGRGRRGRTWEAPPNSSLLVSVVLCPPPAPAPVALVTVACALAAADACGDVAGFVPGLKWPNDLVVGGRKLAGVLASAALPLAGDSVQGTGPVVVGLGLNVRWPGPMPADLEAIAVTAEAIAEVRVDLGALLNRYLIRLEERCRDLADAGGDRADAGVPAMMDEYRRRCVTLGRTVRVELPGGRVLSGVAVDVDGDGSLQVRTEAGLRRVTAGDVVHVR